MQWRSGRGQSREKGAILREAGLLSSLNEKFFFFFPHPGSFRAFSKRLSRKFGMWIFPSQNVNGIQQYNSHKYHPRDIIRTIQPARNSPHNTIRIFSTRHGDINVSFTSHRGTLRRRIRPVFNSYCQVCEASRVELLLAFNAAVRSFPLCRALE